MSKSHLELTTISESKEIDPTQKLANEYYKKLELLESTQGFLAQLLLSFPKTSCLNVLSIACGWEPIELQALKQFFNKHNLSFNYLGTDIDSTNIDGCKKKYSSEKNAKFVCLDSVDHEQLSTILKEQDMQDIHLVIARHPVFVLDDIKCFNSFTKIFNKTIPTLLKPGGSLLVSIYNDTECEQFIDVMKAVTDSKPITLPESTAIFRGKETRGFLGYTVELYSDRYFYAYTQFQAKKTALLSNLLPQNTFFGTKEKEDDGSLKKDSPSLPQGLFW